MLLALAALAAPAPAAPLGVLMPLAPPAGCITAGDFSLAIQRACQQGPGLTLPGAIAVSPDDRHVYVAGEDSVAAFARDRVSGALTQLPGLFRCISEFGNGGVDRPPCVNGRALTGANRGNIIVSPDGRYVYVASRGDVDTGGDAPERVRAVAVFFRDLVSGALTQLPGQAGCMVDAVTSRGTTVPGCGRARALGSPTSLLASPDGRHLYVMSSDLARGREGKREIAAFTRDAETGVLNQLPGDQGCMSSSTAGCRAPPDGFVSDQLAAFSPDGRALYLGDHVRLLRRDPASGALLGLREDCLGDFLDEFDLAIVNCPDPRGATKGLLSFSADGRNAYLAGEHRGFTALSVFTYEAATGRLKQFPGPLGCFTPGGVGGCTPATFFGEAGRAVTLPSRDGRNLHLLQEGISTFRRDPRNGTLSQFPEPTICRKLRVTGCSRIGQRLFLNRGAITRDGSSVYGAGSATVAVLSRGRGGPTPTGLALLVSPRGPLILRGDRVPVVVRCARGSRSCAGSITLVTADRSRTPVAFRRFLLSGGRRGAVRVRLSRSGAALVRARRAVRVRSIVTSGGGQRTGTATLRAG